MSTYVAKAIRTSIRAGNVSGEPDVPVLQFSAPPEFKGKAETWTPEHLFTGAIATCFITTFEAIAEFSKFVFSDIEVSAEGVLEKTEAGYRFTRVFVRPVLSIRDGAERDRAIRLLEKAERACLISKSISSEIVLQPSVEIAKAV